jgi:hypothetical protein
MRIFPPTLEIGPTEGFSATKDIFKRAPLGRGLSHLLENSADPLVVAIDGQWGTGKSTFLLMWAGELRKMGFPVIYFDAFAHDYLEDAFEALAGEIVELANAHLKSAASKKIKDAAISAGKVLIKVGASVGIRAATAGILSAKDFSDVASDAKDVVGDAADKIIEEALVARKKQRQTLDTFRETLSKLPTLLSDTGKPLVFIIDELDRCKPTFALAILESVKHFFAVPNVHFVLGAHIRQLENSVKVTYGSGIDAHLYLQKFISLTVNLDVPGEYRHESDVFKYLEYLKQNLEFRPQDQETLRYVQELIAEFARYRDIKLRTLEKIMGTVAIALAYTEKNYFRLPPILAGLCVMKVIAPDLYAKAQRGTLTYDEAVEFFDLNSPIKEEDGSGWPSEYFAKWWRYALDPKADPELISGLRGSLFNFNIRNRYDVVPITANNVIDRFTRGVG